MVHKIKLISLLIIIFLLGVISVNLKGNIEVNLLKTMLPSSVINNTDIVPVTNKSASVVKIVFESDNDENVQALKDKFTDKVDKNDFEIRHNDFSGLLKLYTSNPANFLSDETRALIKSKNYDEVRQRGLEELYNPLGLQLSTMDRDPYFLLNDFLLSNKRPIKTFSSPDGMCYESIALTIKNADGLSPNLVNEKISKLIKIQRELSDNNSKIYLAGSPIHSYHTSKKSVFSINIICILSSLLIIFLTYHYFKNIKLFIPITLSIIMGMLIGYIATRLWFNDFQIITMVFSSALIGIGIDYSYHYFFADKKDSAFLKSLTMSLFTTIVPFLLLYFSGIDLLRQVSVFICFGLIGIYTTVVIFFPSFEVPDFDFKADKNLCKTITVVLLVLAAIGYIRLRPNDTLTTFYTPTKALKKAETLYNKVSGMNYETTQIITVQADDFDMLLEKEEGITSQLYDNGVEYICLSKLLPSKAKQKENFDLVKELYKNNLHTYSDILTKSQTDKLCGAKFSPIIFRIDEFPFLSEFMLDENKSMILVHSDGSLANIKGEYNLINIKSDIEHYVKKYRISLLKLFPIVIVCLFIILLALYGFKSAVKVLAPPIAGIIGGVGLVGLISGEVNLFSIIAMFLVLGFTMDYSIFRTNNSHNCENAIFASALTTSFSFLLLSLCGFKLISSISAVLFFGIILSYLCGAIVFSRK